MSTEQKLLERWRGLPSDKQQQVLEFVEFLHFKTINAQDLSQTVTKDLGERLRKIRSRIVTPSEPFLQPSSEAFLNREELELNREEIKKEITNPDTGLQESEQESEKDDG